MMDLVYAIGLVLMIEGIAYALIPDSMKRMMVAVLAESSERLRWSGLAAACFGFFLIWLTRS